MEADTIGRTRPTPRRPPGALGYGLLAFKLGSAGTLVGATTLIPAGTTFYLDAYAVLAADGSICTTVINQDSSTLGSDGRAANITLNLPASYKITSAQTISLYLSRVTNTTGITLGGHAISEDGSFTPAWTPVTGSIQVNALTVTVPPASATLVKLVASRLPATPTGLTTTALSDTPIALNRTRQATEATADGVDVSADKRYGVFSGRSVRPPPPGRDHG